MGEKATRQTPRLCPLSVANGDRVAASQRRIVRSCEQEASKASFGERATLLISLSCPRTECEEEEDFVGVKKEEEEEDRDFRWAVNMGVSSQRLMILSLPPLKAMTALEA